MTIGAATSPVETSHISAAVSSPVPCEISHLLMRAINCIDHDRVVAMDFIHRASQLLKPDDIGDAIKPRGLAPWQIKRVRDAIEDRISRSITLDELAALVRLSTSYFSSSFKVSFGVSPHNYILARRVEHAKRRMIESDAPLCEIALDCGLADQAHLCRVFRRVTGATPSGWRRLAANPDVRGNDRWSLSQVA